MNDVALTVLPRARGDLPGIATDGEGEITLSPRLTFVVPNW